VLFKWFIATHSEGKSMTGIMIIEKAKSVYEEIKITDKYRSSNEKLPVRTDVSIGTT
jgi:hypothetical protein